MRSLATRFNQMVARLGVLVRSQEAFVADASHQLRTPLAALRLRLENLDRDVAHPKAALERAMSEVERLGRLVDGLLALARADEGAATAEMISLTDLVEERVDLWGALADEQGVTVTADTPAGLAVRTTPGRLDQVLDNLIENALAVSPEGGTITVRAATSPYGVRDPRRGRGAGDDRRGTRCAFDRFWRSERTTTDGTGLGLAIVRRLVESDGGTVELRAASGGGLDVAIDYPRPGAPV